MLVSSFTAVGYAEGLQTESAGGKVGDSFTVSYVVPKKVENVGAITLYLNYDSSTLVANGISPQKPTITNEDGDISRMAPKNDSSGRIVASWVEPYCSMVLESGFVLLTVEFTFIKETSGTELSCDIILKGLATPDSNGNDDLSYLLRANNSSIEISTEGTIATSYAEPSSKQEKDNQESVSAGATTASPQPLDQEPAEEPDQEEKEIESEDDLSMVQAEQNKKDKGSNSGKLFVCVAVAIPAIVIVLALIKKYKIKR